MTKALMLFGITVLLVLAIVSLQPSSSEVKIQKNTTSAIQVSGINWNATDFNTTITQQTPNLNVTITPRIIVEYGDTLTNQPITPFTEPFQISPRIIKEYADAALQLGINAPQGLNTTGLTPRIMNEYTDYATYSYAFTSSYPGVTLGLSIGSPVENPANKTIPIYTNKTISFNVTSSLGRIKSITFSFRTSLNQTWQPYTLPYAWASNVTLTTAHEVIPGQSQPCNVTYKIEAYSYPYTIDNVTNSQGDYVKNDNAGQYYVYKVVPVPEFPLTLILPLLVLATLFGAIIYKKWIRPLDE